MGNKNRAFDHRHYTDWRKPEELIPYEKNAKIHDEKQIRNLVTSLKRFGWQQDCVITSDNVLVIGHGRRMAAMQIGCEIPVHVIDKKAEDLTDEDIRELRIADNQTNAETGFDFDMLQEDLEGLDFEGFDFDFDRPKRNDIHPTMKPIGLFDYLIQNSSKRGDLVLDTFGGSGTAIMACEQDDRTCYTMELDPRYVDAIIDRWQTFTGEKAVLISE